MEVLSPSSMLPYNFTCISNIICILSSSAFVCVFVLSSLVYCELLEGRDSYSILHTVGTQCLLMWMELSPWRRKCKCDIFSQWENKSFKIPWFYTDPFFFPKLTLTFQVCFEKFWENLIYRKKINFSLNISEYPLFFRIPDTLFSKERKEKGEIRYKGTKNNICHKGLLVSVWATQILLGKSHGCPASGDLCTRMLASKITGDFTKIVPMLKTSIYYDYNI